LANSLVGNHKESALLVGDILASAFLLDADFRKALSGPNQLLQKAASDSTSGVVKFGLQSSFNTHVVSSYHAARSIELLFAEILGRMPKHYDLLWLVMHSFALETVFGLGRAKQLFTHRPVRDLLGDHATEIICAFDSKFPQLKETRDALAHDDERIFGIVKGNQLGKSLGDQ
jgi:hypothetical protein